MPTAKPQRPQQRAQLQTGTLLDADPSKVSRHLSELATAVQAQGAKQADRTVVVVDLVVGVNKINHGLGRAARVANVTPTTADATFAYALTGGDSLQAQITVVGVPQTKAAVEFA